MDAIKTLKLFFNWQEFGKHHESILTKFYNSTFCLINLMWIKENLCFRTYRSNQITRIQGEEELKNLFMKEIKCS